MPEMRKIAVLRRAYAAFRRKNLKTGKAYDILQSRKWIWGPAICRQEETIEMNRREQEIHEAIAAADDALYALERAQKSLSSAGTWGIFDMLGGGFFTSIFKHGKLDQAQAELEEARAALHRFSSELADVDREVDLQIDIGEFLRFADFFFDGFVADWMVQSKIRNAERQVKQAIYKVENIRRQLWSMLG